MDDETTDNVAEETPEVKSEGKQPRVRRGGGADYIAKIEDAAPEEEETPAEDAEPVKVPRGKRGFIYRGPAHSLEFNDHVLHAGDNIVVKAADADALLALGKFEEVAQPDAGDGEKE